MQANIENKLAFNIAGKEFVIKDRLLSKDIRDKFFDDYKDILKDKEKVYGLMEYDALKNEYKYILGFEISDKETIDKYNFKSFEVSDGNYLEVPVKDEDSLEKGYNYTYKEFFPNKKYFHGLGPDIELYQYDQAKKAISHIKLFIFLRENPKF